MKKKIMIGVGVFFILVLGLVVFHFYPRNFHFDYQNINSVIIDVLEPYGTFEVTKEEDIHYLTSVLNDITYSRARPSQGKGSYIWIKINGKEIRLLTDNRMMVGGLVYTISDKDGKILEECINGILVEK